ncbi:DMT family transporter [Stygiobacter electus]|jgi:drug/metabolite transporter (DMT)-like permease|uniref:DMT family transporter n=1 Tax=Stygiobacter electus TaxID=3032292 RepID=A0AAE3TAT4_9BACT|nr:DMT family transporter [Stygiobacter electus]MDF1610588.1 DMT family transporter [Stygiobacter electus]
MKSETVKIVLGYILICLIWGSTWLAIRLGLDSLTPILSAGFRFSIASILVFVFMKIQKLKLQTDPLSIKIYLILGFFSFLIPFGLVYWAEQFIPSGLASVLFSVMPFFVIIFSYIFLKEEIITVFQIIGSLLGFIGVAIIFLEKLHINFENDFWGMLAVLISSILQAGIAIILKKYAKHLNPLSMNFVPLAIAGSSMMIIGLSFENISHIKINLNAVVSVLYLALFGTVITFSTYYWLMKKINLLFLSLSTFITPIIAVILGWIILKENFSFQALIGSILVLVGILFANFTNIKAYLKSKLV